MDSFEKGAFSKALYSALKNLSFPPTGLPKLRSQSKQVSQPDIEDPTIPTDIEDPTILTKNSPLFKCNGQDPAQNQPEGIAQNV